MKVFSAIILALSASSTSAHRGGGGRGGDRHNGGKTSFTQAIDDGKCDEPEFCDDAALVDALDCTALERPRHQWDNDGDATGEEKDWDAIKAAKEEARDAFHEDVLRCVCCKEVPLEDVLPSRDGEGGEWGEHGGKRHGGRGRGGGRLTQDMVNDKCAAGEGVGYVCPASDCDNVAKQAKPEITEDETAWIAHKAAMKKYREQAINCACCNDLTLENMGIGSSSEGKTGDGSRWVLASLLENESVIQTEEDSSSASCLSLALSFAAAGVALVFV